MAPNDQERAADAVRSRRGELGLTQQQLAGRAGVDTGTISSLELAERWPWAKNRVSIERALGWEAGSLDTIARGGVPVLAGQDTGQRPRYLDPAEQHIADTPGITPEEAEALIAVARSMRAANARRTGT
jgi:transcriptional regulator with XRE-family HTH domain